MKLVDNFRGMAKSEVQRGDSILLTDEWEIDQSRVPLRTRFARLFSFVNDDKLSIQQFLSQTDLL